MDLKKLLKILKLNESSISIILGAIVIVIFGILLINITGRNKGGETIPAIGTEKENVNFPTTHTVTKGEDLWKISIKYYDSGYNWTDIAAANNLKNPGLITTGEELIIPDVTPKVLVTNTPTPVTENTQISEKSATSYTQTITGSNYTVVKGDDLWKIAVRAYGDGYKWIDIARANNLINPNLIHPGNALVLPR